METATAALTTAVNAASAAVTSTVSAVSAALPTSATGDVVHDEPEELPPKPDESPLNKEESKTKLERRLSSRPDKKDLVDKNILKDTNVAPSLQEKAEQLKRAQLEDTIERNLQDRVRQMSLYEEDAANSKLQNEALRSPDETPIDPISSAAVLEKNLKKRPEKEELVERNILKDSKVAPGLQAAQEDLKRSQLEDKLETLLQQRPKPDALVKEGILKEDEVPVAQA